MVYLNWNQSLMFVSLLMVAGGRLPISREPGREPSAEERNSGGTVPSPPHPRSVKSLDKNASSLR